MDNSFPNPGEHPVPVHGVSPEPPDPPETTGPMAIIQAALLALSPTVDMCDLEPHEIAEIAAPGFLAHVSQQADRDRVLCLVPLENNKLVAMVYRLCRNFWQSTDGYTNRVIISAASRLSGEPVLTMIDRIYGEYTRIPPGGWSGDWPETTNPPALRALMRHCLQILERHIPEIPHPSVLVKGVCFL